jgi:hypothetical protein
LRATGSTSKAISPTRSGNASAQFARWPSSAKIFLKDNGAHLRREDREADPGRPQPVRSRRSRAGPARLLRRAHRATEL